ncbi:MAG: nucleotidyltransferase family protein [Acidimicrobiales bacterium]
MTGTAAVLLAAGAGTRFTGPSHKLLAVVEGRPLISYALANMARSDLAPLVVVTGGVDLGGVISDGVVVIANPDWAEGMATSLAAAVRWADAEGLDAVVVGLADQPAIEPGSWRAVASSLATPIAVATYNGRRGHPVRLARAVWDRLPATGDRGARAVMAASPELVTEVACDGDPTDVDTVEDLKRWR